MRIVLKPQKGAKLRGSEHIPGSRDEVAGSIPAAPRALHPHIPSSHSQAHSQACAGMTLSAAFPVANAGTADVPA